MKEKALMKKTDKQELVWAFISLIILAWNMWSWFEVVCTNSWSKGNCFRIICAICNYIHG